MKKYPTFIISFLLVMMINIKNVYAIKINKDEITLGIGYSENLNVSGASSNSVTWTSTNEGIITVNNGLVTAKSVGTAYISVTDGVGSDTCKINVINNFVPVSNISLSKNEDTIKVGETKKIGASILPNNATNKTISYSSMNTAIAKVDTSGNVTGVAVGSTYISLVAESKSVLYKIDVVNPPKDIKLSSISIPGTYELTEGGTGKLTVTYSPSNATNKNITWKSSNNGIVTVDSGGNLKAIAPGSATITATSKDGNHVATSKITVNALDKTLKGISLNKTEIKLEIGKTEKLTVNYNPNNTDTKGVSWRSSNSTIAKVEEGVITAIKPGNVEIKVTSDEGNFQAVCKVTVLSPPIDSISFKNETEEVFLGETVTLETVSVPVNTMINNPIWTSSDEEVATIDELGNLTAIKLGTTTITISDKEGKVTASTTVNVIEKPDETLMIKVEGYNINFDPNIKTYDITIKKEQSLNISVNRDSSKYIIGGNRDLKNGSVITITVYDNEKTTYMINIRKKENFPIGFIIVISVLLIINIIRILVKNKKKYWIDK